MTWRWPSTAETCRYRLTNKYDPTTVVFWQTHPPSDWHFVTLFFMTANFQSMYCSSANVFNSFLMLLSSWTWMWWTIPWSGRGKSLVCSSVIPLGLRLRMSAKWFCTPLICLISKSYSRICTTYLGTVLDIITQRCKNESAVFSANKIILRP